MSIVQHLQPSQDNFDHLKETKYCLKFSKLQMESIKKQKFRNKLCFDYSLQKINRQKLYGNLIPFSSKIYPSVQAKGLKFCNQMYSSEQVKNRRRSMSNRYQNEQSMMQKQQMKRYKRIISQKKNQQGGIDSFWIFKKDPVKDQKKKTKGIANQGAENQANEQNTQDKTKIAYIKILTFAKLPIQIQNSLIPRNSFSKYISTIFGETFCIWFINFYQIKPYINYKQYQIICEKFRNISLRECHLVSFFLYDDNGDGFLCPRDLFAVFQRQLTQKIDKDILKMGDYVKNNIGRKDNVNEEFKIQNVCIRDDFLTIKDYEMYFKKVDQPYLKATSKKDTVFSKSFAVLDHREKIRSKRRQMNEKKTYYEQLYDQIKKVKNQAYINFQNDYKLNYSLLFEIFGNKSTQLYNYFMHKVFGIENIKFS